MATLLTNALPIAAGTIVLDEPVPPETLGALRVMAFVAVITGSVLLARPEKPSKTRTQHRVAEAASADPVHGGDGLVCGAYAGTTGQAT